jgi:drug/metabolite transporter (DMT)-like permease
LSFILWLKLLADTTISRAAPITAVAYFLILLMSWTVFREPIVPFQIVGSVLILAGVWLIATASIRGA